MSSRPISSASQSPKANGAIKPDSAEGHKKEGHTPTPIRKARADDPEVVKRALSNNGVFDPEVETELQKLRDSGKMVISV
ncbi:MAG: hypothetical protein LBI39_01280 [Puniceicoccales bacterium]|jgi:hypothetical protein|nr:hypothetical protein [Puniceicoccales bacterium]